MSDKTKTITINVRTAGHEHVEELMGGDASGHYHMTEEEYNLMLRLVEKLRDEDETGEDFYKLPESEYDKLHGLFRIFYPDDDTDAEDALETLINSQAHIDIINGGKVSRNP